MIRNYCYFPFSKPYLAPLTGLEPACIQLPFQRFRKPRGYSDMNCLTCDKYTTNLKYCTRSCAASMNNRLFPKRDPAKSIKCRRCKKFYHPKDLEGSSSCKTCREDVVKNKEKYKRQTLGEFKKKYENTGVHRSWWYSEIRQLAREINKHRQKICQISSCQYSLHVEYCHIIAISDFKDTTTLAEISQESNIAILCPNHHWELDNGLLSL